MQVIAILGRKSTRQSTSSPLIKLSKVKIFARYVQRPEQQAGCSFGAQSQWTGALLKLPFTHSSDPTMIGIAVTVTQFCHNLDSSMARSLLLLLLLLLSS